MTTSMQPRTAQQPAPDELVMQLVNAIASVIAAKVHEQTAPVQPAPMNMPAPSPSAIYLTVNEAAELLRCKPQRIYNLLYERQIDRYRDGGRILIRRDEIESWVTGAQQATAGARRTRTGTRSAS